VFGEAGDAVVAKDAIVGKPVHELAEVVAGKAGGRAGADEITLFKSVGTGIQDIALAAVIYEHAVQRGVGTPLPDFPYLKKS
jgi:ornithine cyclodeaminase/alanine dehydrogenase-like protein (mu-crystallin family)